MLLIDDLLGAPVKGVLWILQEVAAAADQELRAEMDRIKEQLRELYLQLEQGSLAEVAFDVQESALLDRLDELEARDGDGDEDVGDNEGEGEDEDEDSEDEDSEDDEDEDDEDDSEDEDEDDSEDEDEDDSDSEDEDEDETGGEHV